MFKDSPGGLSETSSLAVTGLSPGPGVPELARQALLLQNTPERGPETRPVAEFQMDCFGCWLWDF